MAVANLLPEEELSRIASRVKPDFIKTSTGFGTGGAVAEDVRLMKENCGPEVQVKAAGGIRSREAAIAMLGSMGGGYNVASLLRLLEKEAVAAQAAEATET